MKSIVGRKMGMTQVFAEDGTMYAVTVVEVLPNVVTQVKTAEKDGYSSIQIGYEDQKENRANKCEKGIFKKANVAVKKHLIELKGDEMAHYAVGDVIKADIFAVGEVIDVLGTSKGKGYTGTIKAYHHKIGPKGHGSGFHRGPGSFANNGRCNNRVIPGKKMAGRRGGSHVTTQNLIIVSVDAAKNVILVKGALPGPNKSLVTLRSAVKTQLGKKQVIKTLIDRKVAPVSEEIPAEVVEEVKVEEAPAAEVASEAKAS